MENLLYGIAEVLGILIFVGLIFYYVGIVVSFFESDGSNFRTKREFWLAWIPFQRVVVTAIRIYEDLD